MKIGINIKHVQKGISLALLSIMLLSTISCGTIIYPDRRNQAPGQIDPAVVLMDGIGLFFFFVPGVIAFGVDFATGAIYLPKGEDPFYLKYQSQKTEAKETSLKAMSRYSIPKEQLTEEFICSFIKEKTGKELTVDQLQTISLDTTSVNRPNYAYQVQHLEGVTTH